MPSVSRHLLRLLALSACAAMLAGAASGCSTTQEKAEKQQAQAKHILDARAKRQQKKKNGEKPNEDGNGKQ